MRLLLTYLKPRAPAVLLCLVLLFTQAVCDLSLPDLMSDIVNTGVQAGGVEKGAPRALSAEAMEFITAFIPDGETAAFINSYEYITAGSAGAKPFLAQFPLTAGKDFYALKTDRPDADIDAVYACSMYVPVVIFRRMAEQAPSDNGALFSGETGFGNARSEQLYAFLPALSSLPGGVLEAAIEASKTADPMITSQVAPTFTGLFYRELGADPAAMQRAYIVKAGFRMLGLTLLVAAITVLVGFIAARLAATVSKNLRRDVFEKVMRFSSAEIDSFSTASLITRTTNDVSQVQMLIIMGIRMMCYAPIMGIGGVIMAVRKSASMSWIIALAVLVVLCIVIVVYNLAMPRFRLQQKLIDRINLISRENLSGLMVVRAFGNEAHEQRRFDIANRELTDVNRFVQRMMAVLMPTMMLVMNLLSITIIWVGSNAIAASTMNIGNMIAFIQYSMQILMSFVMIAVMFVMVPRAAVSAKRIEEVLLKPFAIKDSEEPVQLTDAKGVIRFDDVCFRYDGAGQDALEHISFTAEPGTTTAFIGATGSGKTTLVNLIPRFYDVRSGAVTIDGVDVRKIPQHELRGLIGYAPQKGVLFSGDISHNIRYGKPDATTEEIREAIKTAQAEDFVDEREGGADAFISQGGANVSGGQKQRLSIARALATDPLIYIFDDAFSALDFKTDAALRRALSERTEDATVLIVAQRIGTIMSADQIIVLEHGKIAGAGTHRALLQSCRAYREIAESQLPEEELS